MITLINKTRRMKTYHLPHDVYCKALGECVCIPLPGRDKKSVCSSITLPAGAAVSNLSDAVLLVPTIAKDVNAGVLQAEKVDTAAAAASSALTREDTKNLKKKSRPTKTQAADIKTGGEP